MIPVFEWKLKYTYASRVEHALIYTAEYRGYEIVQEIVTKKKYGKFRDSSFGDQKTIYYEAKSKPVFASLTDLLEFVQKKPTKQKQKGQPKQL